MDDPRSRKALIGTLALLAIALGLAGYKLFALDYRLSDVLPRSKYTVEYQLSVDGHGDEATVRSFLPVTDPRQTIGDETDSSPGFAFASDVDAQNRNATWSGDSIRDGAAIVHRFSVLSRAVRYEIDPAVTVPATYPDDAAIALRPEKDIQVDDPAITTKLKALGAEHGTVRERLERIYAFTSKLPSRPFKGTTDALTALRLGEASCNGKSRLFVALARAAGIPARLVGGLILETATKKTSHQWVEAYVAGHWVPFCPLNHHFAEIPQHYLTLYRGDEALFTHTASINFQYEFRISKEQVPSEQAKHVFQAVNVWALFERLKLPFSLLGTVLMLPVGALVVVLFRNVVGLPTFGTFLPALIAGAAAETGALWGLVGVGIVVAVVGTVRFVLERFELLHSPTLAILLAVVTTTLLATSLLAERVGLTNLSHVTFLPIAVLAITAERFYLSLTERGSAVAAAELGGTLAVILACYVVMSSLALRVLVVGFPEVLLVVVALNLYLGRWTGIRISEYIRFRGVLGLSRARA